jgi:predicted Zn-dependent protease
MNGFIKQIGSIAGILVVFFVAIQFIFPAPCTKPLEYTIGRVDPQFHMSREMFLHRVQQAENIWEQQEGKQLFVYNPNAQFTVNVIYDERQQVTDQANTLTSKLSQTSSQAQSIKQQYDQLHVKYVQAQQRYQSDLDQYQKDLQAFNTEVSAYNTSHRTSQSQYEDLVKKQSQLQEESDSIEVERVALNNLAEQVNATAKQDSQIVQTYNQGVQQFNQLIGGKREFDQGEYVGNAINIYEFEKNNDLQLVLEHELGHALGIGHVENQSSIMYYQVNPKNISSKDLSDEDKQGLASTCSKSSWDVFISRLQTAFQRVQ